MKLNNNIAAIVTGGASGLGRGVAEALSQAGVKLAIFDLNPEGQAVADSLGGIFCEVDVTDAEAVAEALAIARGKNGQERICVNCAGIAPAAKTVSRGAAHDSGLFAKVIGINLIGSFNVASQAAAGMAEAEAITSDGERGVIINTASVAAFDGQIGQAAYSASKAGVAGMTLPIARDLSRTGIRVNTIAPGIFETPMMMGAPDQVRLPLIDMVQFPKRLGDAPEFAALAVHMMENTYLNGETVRLDGGIRMQPK